MSITLVLGGARSGKSSYAEKLATLSDQNVVYVATAQIRDRAIQERVSQHQQSRPSEWLTVESPLALGDVLVEHAKQGTTVLVDCLTMWVTNLLCENDASTKLKKEQHSFFTALKAIKGDVIFVSNEVGMGIIPMGDLTRDYVDIAGRLHQDIAAVADNVVLVVAGLPMMVKGKE
jgi:adenosylcobinamide kinase/adenosylcobinamide-phosphate guanylyltransferase